MRLLVYILSFLPLLCFGQIDGRSMVYRLNTNPNLVPGLTDQDSYYETILAQDMSTGIWYDYLSSRVPVWQPLLAQTVTTFVANPDGTYTYTSEDGTQTTTVPPGAETVTTLTDNGNGSYTYVSENSTATTFSTNDIITSIVDNGNSFTYTNEDNQQTTIVYEVLTSLNISGNTLQYVDEQGQTTSISLPTETLTSIQRVGNNLIYTDENGQSNTIGLPTETLTTLSQNPDGSYTYTNEQGQTSTINADVVTSLSLTGQVLTYLDELGNTNSITLPSDVLTTLSLSGNVLTYVNELGQPVVITLPEETVTTLSTAGTTVTYTSEDGTVTSFDYGETNTSISLTGNVITYIDELGNPTALTLPPDVLTDISISGNLLQYTDEQGVTIDYLLPTETITTLVANPDNTYTYTSEDGTQTIINDVVTSLSYNSTSQVLTYTDEQGVPTNLSIGSSQGQRQGVYNNLSSITNYAVGNGYTVLVIESPDPLIVNVFSASPIPGDVVDIVRLIENTTVIFTGQTSIDVDSNTSGPITVTDNSYTRCMFANNTWYCKTNL